MNLFYYTFFLFVFNTVFIFSFFFFFFNDTATTEIYTLSLHDALPISKRPRSCSARWAAWSCWTKTRSEEHTSELQSHVNLVCRLLLEKKKKKTDDKRYAKAHTDFTTALDVLVVHVLQIRVSLFFSVLMGYYHGYDVLFFFFNDTATTEIYTLSLHDALPISDARDPAAPARGSGHRRVDCAHRRSEEHTSELSHMSISYAVFCLKKNKKKNKKMEKKKKKIKSISTKSTKP